jgi:hypothetical protein
MDQWKRYVCLCIGGSVTTQLTLAYQPTISQEEVRGLVEKIVGKETADAIQAMLDNPADKKATVTCPVGICLFQ